MKIKYEVIGKATTQSGDGHVGHAIKLLYRGDGTPWWTCSAGLELPVSKDLFDALEPGGFVTLTVEPTP